MNGGDVEVDVLAAAYGIRSLIGIVVYKPEESDCSGEEMIVYCR